MGVVGARTPEGVGCVKLREGPARSVALAMEIVAFATSWSGLVTASGLEARAESYTWMITGKDVGCGFKKPFRAPVAATPIAVTVMRMMAITRLRVMWLFLLTPTLRLLIGQFPVQGVEARPCRKTHWRG